MSKLFIRSLSWETNDESLRAKFGEFGTIEEAVVVKDRETGRSRGFGFVKYTNGENAQTAIENMNNAEFEGRVINVVIAEDRRGGGGGGGSGGGYQGGRGGGGGSYEGGNDNYGGGQGGYNGGNRGGYNGY